jgi:hypothetical protein
MISIFTENRPDSIFSIGHWANLLNKKSNGPDSVKESIKRGFNSLKVPYNVNPSALQTGDTVLVLSGIDLLKHAIKLKRIRKIKKIVAGPNIAMLPSQIISLNNSNLIDIYIHPSAQIIKWWNYLDPDFRIKQKVWYAGVDSDYWEVSKKTKEQILIYKKKCPDTLFNTVKKCLEKSDLPYEIIEYGKYSTSEYKSLLSKSSLVIYLSESESQGIALFEAWSCNTPTLVWNRGFGTWDKYRFSASSSPYLSKSTGTFFKNIQEFEPNFKKVLNEIHRFHPKKWIISNGTDKVTTKKLLKIINNIK